MKQQLCFECDEPTGRVTGEDSMVCELCDTDPLCEVCWEKHVTRHTSDRKKP